MARALYMRVGGTWRRRKSYTVTSETWALARRVPRQVRAVGDETPPGGNLVVEFDTVAKAAKQRPWW